MGLRSFRWSPVVSGGLRWSPMVSVVSGGLRWSPLVSGGLRCSPVVSGGLRWSPWISVVSIGLRWSPLVSGGLWWSLMTLAMLCTSTNAPTHTHTHTHACTPHTHTHTRTHTHTHFSGKILAAVREQRQVFEGATGAQRQAQESQKLLAVLFYTALPPGHAKEFQTLHMAVHDDLPWPAVDPERPNCLHITANGRRDYLLLADYKTHKSYGDHFLPLDEGSLVLRHLAVHLNDHRKELLGPEQHSTVLFLVSIHPRTLCPCVCGRSHHHHHHHHHHDHHYARSQQCICSNSCPSSAQNERGAPYSVSSWTSYIETILERHTQKRIGVKSEDEKSVGEHRI